MCVLYDFDVGFNAILIWDFIVECGFLYDYECGHLYDYECQHLYDLRMCSRDEECAAEIFICLVFLGQHGNSECPCNPEFLVCPVFPERGTPDIVICPVFPG